MFFAFLCLDDVFYQMSWWFMVLYISRPISSVNDEKISCKTPKNLNKRNLCEPQESQAAVCSFSAV